MSAPLSVERLGATITHPNHERIAFAARSFAGALPILWLVGAVWGLLLVAWWTNPGDLVFLAIVLAFSGAVAVLSITAARKIAERTPTSVEIGSSYLTAHWTGRGARSEDVPFGRIVSVEDRSWFWTTGKGAYARFTPATVNFAPVDNPPMSDVSPVATNVLYVSDPIADLVRTRLEAWSVGSPLEPRAGNSAADPEGAGAWGLVDR